MCGGPVSDWNGVPEEDPTYRKIHGLRPIFIKGYNDRRDAVQFNIPNEDDMGDDPFGRGYTRLQREWLLALMRAVETFQEGEADGVSADESSGTLEVHWGQATQALQKFVRFCNTHWKVLGPGPGSSNDTCMMCNMKPARQSGADLCLNCATELLTLEK